MRLEIAVWINEYLIWLVLAAAIAGIALPEFAFLSGYVSWILFVMVLGLGLQLSFADFRAVFRKPVKVIVPLVVQYSVVPLLALGLSYAAANQDLATGILIIGAAPAEITSALMVFMAGGNLALGTSIMSVSILLSPLLMPFVLALFLGQSVNLDVSGILQTLLYIVLLPVIGGAWLRTTFEKLKTYEHEFSAISAVMVILLIFVVAANNASVLLSTSILPLAGLLLLFSVASYLVGYSTSWLTGGRTDETYTFTIGMKEFGVATAVALEFFGAQAAVPAAIYGIIMLLTAPVAAKLFRRRQPEREAKNIVNEL